MNRAAAISAIAAVLAGVPWVVASGGRCTIVYDGTRAGYDHEYAHCLGWSHPTFAVATPPRKYRSMPYDGDLTVIECGRGLACKDAGKRCYAMWRAQGIEPSAYNAPSPSQLMGCQFDQ
jgi:hypothetical protein